MKAMIGSMIGMAFLMAACGGSDAGSVASPHGADENREYGFGSIVPGTFVLDEDLGAGEMCDLHVKLVLANGFVGPLASLKEKVEAGCDLEVPTSERAYNLVEKEGECGSRLYVGERDEVYEGDGLPGRVTVVDHRARTCKDRVEAPVIVTEEFADRTTRVFYSRP